MANLATNTPAYGKWWLRTRAQGHAAYARTEPPEILEISFSAWLLGEVQCIFSSDRCAAPMLVPAPGSQGLPPARLPLELANGPIRFGSIRFADPWFRHDSYNI